MRTITLREHEVLKIGDGPSCFPAAQAHQLSLLRDHLPAGALTWGHNQVKFAQFCGVIRLAHVQLEILPKISGYEDSSAQARHLVIRMLKSSGFLRISSTGIGGVGVQPHYLLDIIIVAFLEHLKAALRGGAIRRYVTHSEELTRVRGRIDMAPLSRRLPTFQHVLPCRFDELSENNFYNQAIKHVLRRLRKESRAFTVQGQVDALLSRFGNVSDLPVSAAAARRLPIDRTIVHWQEVMRQCVWFLESIYPDVFTGGDDASVFLFDMNRLFEAFVASAVGSRCRRIGLQMSVQRPSWPLARDLAGMRVFFLKPDMVVGKASGVAALVMDTKWKMLDRGSLAGSIAKSDVYQLFVYSRRYAVQNVALLYPAQTGLGATQAHAFRTENDGVTISAVGVDLEQPMREDGALWALIAAAAKEDKQPLFGGRSSESPILPQA